MVLSKQQLQAQNQTIFSSIADKYDFMNKITSLGMEPFWKKRAIKCLHGINPNSIILDLCGGTGDLTNLALRHYGQGRYIVYDLNPAMLAAGKAKIPAKLREHVTYMQGDAMQLPFADDTIDKVMICFGLRNVPNVKGCLQEIARVLKPGGQLVCLEFAIPPNAFLRLWYRLYMATFVRLVTLLVTRQHATYRYLADSITHFARPQEVECAIAAAGLTKRRRQQLFCGIGYIYNALK